MVGFLILALAVALAAYLLITALPGANASSLARILRWLLMGAGGISALFFMFTGRAGLVVLSLILVLLGILARAGGAGTGGPTIGRRRRGRGTSDVETEFLRMSLDHASGTVSGTVLRGRFEGREIEELSLEELLWLLEECMAEDEQSANLLMSYLDREHPDWRERTRSAGGGSGPGGPMTPEEAYEILGLEQGASEEDIRRAHRRLMSQHHPDRGGTTWYAAKLNQAKELLLGR